MGDEPMIGSKIRQLREEAGMSREDLAHKLEISYWALSKYETEDRMPDYELIGRIATQFNVSVDYLLGRTNIKDPIETIAAHRSDDPMDELPEEARKSLEEFKEYILKKYGYKN
jgi:transcriptional regulator with XRE-family HTH domain